MKTKRITKKQKAEIADFHQRVKDTVLALGGKPGGTPMGIFQFAYDMELETAAGKLGVSLHLDNVYYKGIYCRFSDVQKAKAVLAERGATESLNPYSGKWNFAFPLHGDNDYCLDIFKSALDKITPAV